MQRDLPRSTLLCASLLAITALQGCRSTPHHPQAAAETATTHADQAADDPGQQRQRLQTHKSHTRAEAMANGALAAQAALRPEVAAPAALHYRMAPSPPPPAAATASANREHYATRSDNPVQRTSEQPLSTFSVDVDTGSYSNVRRMLRQGVRPPADAVRAEEFINYFDYRHPAPNSLVTPFRVSTELAPAPWDARRQLLMIGIKGYDLPKASLPAANLVFLLDTSGSMETEDKLPLLKQSLAQLVPQLRQQDRVSIVVYAGSAGLVLAPTPGDQHARILAALDQLAAGGSTNGGDGIRLAYAMARQAFIKEGVNRVILATDGDFNVGTTRQQALETLVAEQRKSGIALTTLGFGQGNYNDALAERLADVGDGNHAYIDSVREARKVLVEQMQGTLLSIARDVKIQIEFNPALVSEYRLIGYENRLLKGEDFANDRVDAGDIGAGHEVTALYEITPAGAPAQAQRLPALRYASPRAAGPGQAGEAELAHLRLRYKLPGSEASKLTQTPILRSSLGQRPSQSLQLASAVAAYADLLRGGTQIGAWGWNEVARAAAGARGEDRDGVRREFLELIAQARHLVAADQAPAIAGE